MRLALHLLLLTGVAHLLAADAPSQTTRVVCPAVSISCPAETEETEKPLTFTADVRGASYTAKFRYNWTVEAGTISAGEGTPSIIVDIAGLHGGTLTATVEVDGLPAGCPAKASCSTTLLGRIGCGRPFDQYGEIGAEDEYARLDNFTIQLAHEPTAHAYIFAYDGRDGRAGRAESRANRAKDYMVETRGADRQRITVVVGGFREEMTFELFIVPPGVEPPQPAPTISPEEVRAVEKPAGGRPR